ncbi:MAG: translation elongation factor Ts [Deltaproteobacteria bacterium]|nr:translation elongation factor Ts [Deltaproteobacteria bacterium]
MAEITAQMVKELRESTGAGMMDCKKALAESGGDVEKAVEYLRKKGLSTAKKRAGRATSEGMIHSYIHMGGKLGALVEVNCETDFVAKNEVFKEFVHDVAMQIAATNPLAVRPEDVPAEILDKERKIYMGQVKEMGKPENVASKIVEGKLQAFLKENCLLPQPFVKNPKISVQDLLNETVAKTGENIQIKRFVRFMVGE